MNIPGLTDQEISEVIYIAAKAASIKYRFGYHSVEDMAQQAAIECIERLNKGKFKPKGDKPVKQQLTNFLKIVCRNALYNQRRNKSYRYEGGDTPANRSKYNIMHPIKIYSQGLDKSEMFAFDINIFKGIDREQLLKRIRDNLSIAETKDFLKYLQGVNIPATRRELLFTKIRDIVSEETQDSLDS